MKKEFKYKCDNCSKKSKTVYYNKKTKGWECDKCTPYLKEEN